MRSRCIYFAATGFVNAKDTRANGRARVEKALAGVMGKSYEQSTNATSRTIRLSLIAWPLI